MDQNFPLYFNTHFFIMFPLWTHNKNMSGSLPKTAAFAPTPPVPATAAPHPDLE